MALAHRTAFALGGATAEANVRVSSSHMPKVVLLLNLVLRGSCMCLALYGHGTLPAATGCNASTTIAVESAGRFDELITRAFYVHSSLKGSAEWVSSYPACGIRQGE